MYIVLKQFIPGIDQIWVAKLTPDDTEYKYNTEIEAQIKADELQMNDNTGRKYKVSFSSNLDS